MEYILKIFQLKYILLQFSVLFLHVGMILVWLGLGKDHVCAANSWKSSSMSKIYECYDSATFCSVTQQHDHQLINVKCSRDTERLVEMSDTVHKKKKKRTNSTAGFAEMLNANILLSWYVAGSDREREKTGKNLPES